MDIILNEAEARVLGALIEKDMATPEYYPQSLNALTNACNQKSNREPVVQYEESFVLSVLEDLRAKSLAGPARAEGRVFKYEHHASNKLGLGNPQLAVIAVLLLRGPQTLAELKERTHRLHAFDDLDAVLSCLHRMIERGIVKELPKQPGTKEPRFVHLLSGDVEAFVPPAKEASPDRMQRLEEEVAELKRDVAEMKIKFDVLFG